MSKYQDVRRRYQFLRVLDSEPCQKYKESLAGDDDDDDDECSEGNNNACVICESTRHALFRCEYRVMEGSLLASDPPMGSLVERLECGKCLNYIHHQRMPAYKAQVRRDHYSEKFAPLIAWCAEHADVAACLPTLAQFATLTSEGKQFKPALVSHVSALISSFRSDPARLTFARWIAAVPEEQRAKAAEHIRFRIDAAAALTESERTQMLAYPRSSSSATV